MKFYKTTAVNLDDAHDRRLNWTGTQADATADRKAFIAEGFSRKEVETVEVEVPTSKAELLAWLNENIKE